MFNLTKEVNRLQQLKHAKTHGLPDKHRQVKTPPTEDINLRQANTCIFDSQAEQEDTYISRRFINKSADFGKRLSKRKGHKHHPGGGYAGHSIKGG